jgi:hypothetical protein
MSRAPLLLAAAVALAVDTSILLEVRANRTETTSGPVELSERELRLVEQEAENTSAPLRLEWDVLPGRRCDRFRPVAEWLDGTKLAALGFECEALPERRVLSVIPIETFIALEVAGETWRRSPHPDSLAQTRLFAVDADRDAAALRRRYPDRARYLLVRGVVRPLLGANRDGGSECPPGRLRGAVLRLVPPEIYVAGNANRALQKFRKTASERHLTSGGAPRYAVTLRFGSRFEPWVEAIRNLPD